MDFNSLFFPAPKDRYTVVTHFGEMLYLPKTLLKQPDGTTTAILGTESSSAVSETIYIPCLLIRYKQIPAL